jgi:hypoxanthine-guanine phosphoribosyltransferase
MTSDFPPEHYQAIKSRLRRSVWDSFPDVVIHAEEATVKKHPLYAVAKSGDALAAEGLILETSTLIALDRICAVLEDRKPFLIAVHAQEEKGANVIPRVFAQILFKTLDLPLANGVVQINRVSHTGADGYHRLAFPALYDGNVAPGEYFLVDDFIGQGGTLANLKGFLESRSATVIGATVLTGKAYSAKLKLTAGTLQSLREKHGKELENWWIATFGYSFECLTESEARYLTRADDANTIRTRIIAASRKGN